jgi:hypothetical protein
MKKILLLLFIVLVACEKENTEVNNPLYDTIWSGENRGGAEAWMHFEDNEYASFTYISKGEEKDFMHTIRDKYEYREQNKQGKAVGMRFNIEGSKMRLYLNYPHDYFDLIKQ